mmetsp:Transcript_15249/g.42201  ORF Transcript_15249/g.42201 Transcript_15249/m.42201 type:complete len:755 (-) Transcript_15249:40-2304(-)
MAKMRVVLGLLCCYIQYATALEDGQRAAGRLGRRKLDPGQKPKEITDYYIYSSEEIEERLSRWSTHYTHLTRVTTSQEEYGLPRAGGANDCPFVEEDGCPNSILTIQDFVAHPEGSQSSKELPEVFLSGELHGNEQVGPTAVMQAAELLLEATSCIELPRVKIKDKSPDLWDIEVQKSKDCRDRMLEFGISEKQMWWLARLTTTRRIVVVPTANALGYFRKKRTEGSVDANRDFPFDYESNPKHPEFNNACMKTIAARTINEIFREHLFQLSFTFHGGMEVIGYEWGAPTYSHTSISPDDVVQNQVAAAYSRYGGGWKSTPPYKYGPMNPEVYPVRGGMEDWAYASSWDPDRVIPCKPSTYSGYPVQKTTYNNSTLRVLNMLVETSNDKIPTKNLGSSWDLLNGFSVAGNGHISRNIRLSLLAAELVQPWLSIRNVNELELTDDIVPLTSRANCQDYKRVLIPPKSRKVVIEWVVGGSLTINVTKLWYAKWSDVPDVTCESQPPVNIEEQMTEGTPISATSGKTSYASTSGAKTAHFSASMDVSDFKEHDMLVVMVSARVDQDWATQPGNVEPKKPPQSHMANARTNPDWHHESAGKVIQGRLDWFSIPLTIEVGSTQKTVETLELSARLPYEVPKPYYDAGDDDDIDSNTEENIQPQKNSQSPIRRISVFLICLIGLVAAGLALRCWVNDRMRRGHRSRLRNFIEDENAPSPGSLENPDDEFEDEVEGGGYADDPTPADGHGEPNGVEMGRYT